MHLMTILSDGSKSYFILPFIQDTCMTFINDGMYNELVTLLSPVEFGPLKPLVLLLGWNYVCDCNNANCLLDALYTSNVVCIPFIQSVIYSTYNFTSLIM